MKHNCKKLSIIIMCVLLCMTACRRSSEQMQADGSNTPTQPIERPSFDADSAYAYVAAQCAFGPRVPNTEAHRQCGRYLTETLQRYCDTVYVQEFTVRAYDGTLLKAKNIIGSFNPQADNRILAAAHWDSRPYADHDPDQANHRTPIEGANDGASGIGVLLEAARQLSFNRPQNGIDLICFDVEDYGAPHDVSSHSEDDWCLGAQHWATHPHLPGYRARFGLLLDMVGGQNAQFCMEGTSLYFARDIMERVWNVAAQLGYSADFSRSETAPIIDDHLYINRRTRIPMIDIIEYHGRSGTGFNPTWHTLEDNLRNIDRRSLQKVGEVLLHTLRNE
ncbi:MAG: M28 family peptidase [Bacteroidales bacterium]|nr:M28 family peptidase [Bacteroidales bacterium]